MALEQKLSLRLSQRLVMTPSLQQAIKLLQMSKLELEEVLNQEMVENPLLEEEQEETPGPQEARDASAEAAAPAPASPTEGAPEPKERDSFEEIDFDSYFEDYLESAYNPRQYEPSEAVPLENTLSSPPGLQEYLSWQLSMAEAPESVREIAAYLIGNVDEDGYLRVTRDEIRAAGFEKDGDTERALSLVRSFDPPGICAWDLPDCLMLQIRALGIENALIEKIITEHWSEFLNRQFAPLARTLGVGMSQLQAVVEIVKNLEPKPGRKYSTERTIYVEPDVAVRKVGDEYVIQLN
ncbi:MAG TPA: RNA polymerase sigma-54 factor, partial [Thermoanaerobaculia bacterium]|nr:RNA polymerase sigma-54 factor [Thermoanaerobaculia bacterium]